MENGELLARLRAFHGHLGPFAMLGYRAGKLALRELGVPPHFGLRARVQCPPHTPDSCFVDGVQYATGCTLGKRNIDVEVSEAIALTVTVDGGGPALTVVPRRDLIQRFGPWMEEANDEAAALRVLGMRDDELFEPPD